MKVKIKVFDSSPAFRTPTRATSGSAGWDIYSPIDLTIPPNTMKTIQLGFGVEIPNGHFLAIAPRSSFGKKKILIPNSIGIIDQDYRGEIALMLLNASEDFFYISSGDRVAQALLLAYNVIDFESVDELTQTNRGHGGLGSTGK